MKVLYAITGLATGGAEMMLLKLLSAMDRKRFTPTVIALTGGEILPRIEALGIPVYCMDFQPGTVPVTSIFRLVHLLRRLRPDVVQGWMYHGNVAVTLVGIDVPTVWGIHCSLQELAQERPLTRLLVRSGPWLAWRVRQIVYCSQRSQYQHESIGYPAAKSVFIPNGLDCGCFCPDVQAAGRIRAELGLLDDTLLVGHAARFHPMKNHVGLMHAFARIAEHYPKAHLVMAGREVTPANGVLAEALTATGLAGRVHLVGQRADMHRLLPAFDVFVSSSWGEAFPIVLGEAMACGVPCVTTDVGDSAAIVGGTGKVVPPRDPTALANAMRELVDMNAETRRALGERARQRIVENFSLESVVHRYEDLYESVYQQFKGQH